MTLAAPTSPFLPAPALYSGPGVEPLVYEGGVWPVAINGRGYMVDLASDQFRRGFEERIRASTDQGALPGEATINPQGLWRRSQDTWHLGAGQEWADDAEASFGRYWESKGIDPWTKGRIQLLPTVTSVQTTTEGKPMIAVTTSRVYMVYGQTVKYAALTADLTSGGSWSSATGAPAYTATGVAASGDTLHIAFATASDTYKIADGATALSAYCTDPVEGLAFVKNRLMAWSSSSLYNITAAGALPTALRTLTTATWVGCASGPNHIYAAASNGVIFRITITDDATSLGAPTAAGELPHGETPMSIDSYLGYILLGTSKGARFCTTDDAGNLIIGPLISTSNQNVRAFAADESYVYFGWPNYSGSSGLGRMHLAQLTAVNAPAFATDLMVDNQTADTYDVEIVNGKPFFSLVGVGYYVEASNKVTTGWLTTGKFAFGIPDPKVVAKLDVRTAPLVGSIDVDVSLDDSAYEQAGAAASPDATIHTFTVTDQTTSYQAGFKFNLDRDVAVTTSGPEVLRWTARSFVAPIRSQIIVVPVLLHDQLRVNEQDRFIDVLTELAALRDLVLNPRICTYQDQSGTVEVLVEDVMWVPDNDRTIDRMWNGTAVVTMRTISE